jgi:hypothetical protein
MAPDVDLVQSQSFHPFWAVGGMHVAHRMLVGICLHQRKLDLGSDCSQWIWAMMAGVSGGRWEVETAL